MKKIFSVTAIFSICLCAVAQNTGFAGKRAVFKLDAYSSAINKFPNFGVELVATRSLTLSLDFVMGNASVKQRYYYSSGGEHAWLIQDGYGREIMPERAKVSHNGFALSLRKYMGAQKLMPAPHGAFFSIGYKQGNLKEISGMVDESQYAPVVGGSPLPAYYKEYTANNISYFGVQSGFGRQFFLKDYLTIDFLIGLSFTKFDMSLDTYGNQVISGVTGSFGPNVFRLHSGKSQNGISSYNIGLFLNLGVGVMLF